MYVKFVLRNVESLGCVDGITIVLDLNKAKLTAAADRQQVIY